MCPTLTIRPIAAAETYDLRHAVLWPDKPLAYVQVAEDAEGQHFGAFVHGELVGVVSLFVDVERGEARFRKLATAEAWRGRGVGTALLRRVLAAAEGTAGVASVWCGARSSALGFYGRFGMRAEGGAWLRGGVEYVTLRRVF